MPSPKDLLAQRNKLQNEILALESSLGNNSNITDLLSSDNDSTDDSDDSGHAGEEAVHRNLEAERQQIQKEIKELEETLGADAALVDVLTDSEHGANSQTDSSDEDDELVLPQNLETCLQMNLVYQEVLKEKLNELERLLNENHQQQKDIEAQLSGPASSSPGLPQLRLFLGNFMKPFFKDKLTGLGPPANEETKEKMIHGTRLCDEIKIKRWEAWQKTLLVKSVVSDTMKHMMQPKMSKMEYLTAKLSKAKEEEKEELKKRIDVLEKDIAQISSMKEEELYGNLHNDHDWDKISNINFKGCRQPEDLKRFWQNYLHPSINKSTWKEGEIKKLAEVAAQFKARHWDKIAEALGTNRTAFMCFQIYQRYVSKTFKKREWTKEEDQVLKELVEKMRIGNFIPYTQMAYFMEGRDYAQLIYRWTGVLDPSLKKGPWTKEEDELLRNAVKKYGCKEWWKIKNEVPGRTDGACRDRYLDCLREGVKRGPWSDEEVELLKKLVAKHGVGKWSKIAAEIPNRIDCQCLNKWKWMTHQAARRGKKRVLKTNSKRRPPSKRRIKTEEDYLTGSDSSSEEENVEYMDSSDENSKKSVPEVEDLLPRQEYIQPDIKEWIPVVRRAQMHFDIHVRSVLVRSPTEEDKQGCGEGADNSTRLYWNTVLNRRGNCVKMFIGADPLALLERNLRNENVMIKVPADEVRHLLNWKRRFVNTKGKRAKTRISSDEGQSFGQNDELEERGTTSGKKIKHLKSKAATKMNYNLMIAVSPWVGNVLIPLPLDERVFCEADVVQTRAANNPPEKMPVFSLLLQALHIDTEGCKKVIVNRKTEVPLIPDLRFQRAKRSSFKTVAQMLDEKNKQNEHRKPQGPNNLLPFPQLIKLLPQQQRNTPQNLHPTGPTVQQTIVIAQKNTQPGVGCLPAVVQPGLQLPINKGKSAQSVTSPTTLTSSLSITEPSAETSEDTGTPKRKRKLTMKAQALLENVKAKASKKQSAKKQQGSEETPTVALLPQTTAWLITPNGFVPVAGIQIKTPVAGQNSVPSTVSNNHNVSLPPSSTTDPGDASTSGTSVPQISVAPPNTNVTGSTIQEPPSNEGIVNIIPQLPVQSPIMVNQNGSLAFLCNFVTLTIPSAAPGVNEAGASSSSSGPNLNPVLSSIPIPNVSSASGVTSTPCIPSASIGASASVVAKPSLQCSPQLELSQPFRVNQDGSLVLTNAAGPPQPAPNANSSGNSCLQPSLASPISINLEKPRFQVGPSFPIGPSIPQAKTQQPQSIPSQTANALTFDANLISFEHRARTLEWMKGNGGITLPEQNKKMPYLPPFVSTINSLASLLKVKESLLTKAEQLLPEEDRDNNDEEAKVAAVRKLVSDRFKTNPAYLLLKARFLSCFTLPAFLATIQPSKDSISDEGCGEEEEEQDKGKVMPEKQSENKDQSQTVDSLLSANESVTASQFPGIQSRKPSDSDISS
ncbi:snRNA-activating protein complex subunit 4 [Trichomycterus rosablanca]|uniref:snRNA-activating protein complex subunit 4 n=1 Tax=Trichomycterus rosablanca TaxID=2290929 RepID=UPI002F350D1E